MTTSSPAVLGLIAGADKLIDQFVAHLVGAPQAGGDLDALECLYEDDLSIPVDKRRETSRREVREAVERIFGQPVYRRVFSRLRDVGCRERKRHGGDRLFVLPRAWRLSTPPRPAVTDYSDRELIAAVDELTANSTGHEAEIVAELARRYRLA